MWAIENFICYKEQMTDNDKIKKDVIIYSPGGVACNNSLFYLESNTILLLQRRQRWFKTSSCSSKWYCKSNILE